MGLVFGESKPKLFYHEIKHGKGCFVSKKQNLSSSKKPLTRASCSILKSLGYKLKFCARK